MSAPSHVHGTTEMSPLDSTYCWLRYQLHGGEEKWKWATVDEIARFRTKRRFTTMQRWARSGEGRDDYVTWPHLADCCLEGDAKTDADLAELGRGFVRVYA